MFKIEVFAEGRWVAVGGTFPTRAMADRKIVEYLMCATWKKTPSYRVVRATR